MWTLCGTSGFRARNTDCQREIADGEARLALTTWGVSELARRLRASSPNRRVRLIAVTGYGTPDDRRRAAEVGCDAHIVKPVGRGIWFVFVTEYLIRGAPS